MAHPQSRLSLAPRPEGDDSGAAFDCDPIDRLASADDLNAIWMMSQYAAFGGNPGDALAYLSHRNPCVLDGAVCIRPLTFCAAMVRRIVSALTGRGGGLHTRPVADAGDARGTERILCDRIEPS